MATPTPFNLAKPQFLPVRRVEHYARDVYNFSYTSVSQGTNNPVVVIPASGPHAAGAIPPSKFPQIDSVTVIVPVGPEAWGDVNGVPGTV